jgi:hypothetical protein
MGNANAPARNAMETDMVSPEQYYCSKTIELQSSVVDPYQTCGALIEYLHDIVLVNEKVSAFLIKSELIQDFWFHPVIIFSCFVEGEIEGW